MCLSVKSYLPIAVPCSALPPIFEQELQYIFAVFGDTDSIVCVVAAIFLMKTKFCPRDCAALSFVLVAFEFYWQYGREKLFSLSFSNDHNATKKIIGQGRPQREIAATTSQWSLEHVLGLRRKIASGRQRGKRSDCAWCLAHKLHIFFRSPLG